MFDAIAPVYDRVNTLMTAGADGRWRRAAVLATGLGPGDAALDAACGTGKLSLGLAERVGPFGRVVGVDLAPGHDRRGAPGVGRPRPAGVRRRQRPRPAVRRRDVRRRHDRLRPAQPGRLRGRLPRARPGGPPRWPGRVPRAVRPATADLGPGLSRELPAARAAGRLGVRPRPDLPLPTRLARGIPRRRLARRHDDPRRARPGALPTARARGPWPSTSGTSRTEDGAVGRSGAVAPTPATPAPADGSPRGSARGSPRSSSGGSSIGSSTSSSPWTSASTR